MNLPVLQRTCGHWAIGISLARCWVQDEARVSSSEYLRGKLLVCVTPLEIGLQLWAVLLVSAGVIGYGWASSFVLPSYYFFLFSIFCISCPLFSHFILTFMARDHAES